METLNARTSDPDTSHAAAHTFSGAVLTRVLTIYATTPGGLTDEELLTAYTKRHGADGCANDSPRKRRSDLSRDKLRDSGVRRLSVYNRAMIVWRL